MRVLYPKSTLETKCTLGLKSLRYNFSDAHICIKQKRAIVRRKDKPAKFYEIFYKPLDGFSAPMNMTGPVIVRFILMSAFILYLAYVINESNDVRDDTTDIVLDREMLVQWQDNRPVHTSSNLQDAIDYCTSLNLGGYSDWRLPNMFELINLGDIAEGNWTLRPAFENILDDSSLGYWSIDGALTFSDEGRDKMDDNYLVRCVRDNGTH